MSSRDTQWNNLELTGEGAWDYNEIGFTYNQEYSTLEGLQVTYNHVGQVTTWTNLDLL